MSIIVEYFAAPDDAAAAGVLYGGPATVFPTLSCGNFPADFAMTEWESLLLGRRAAQHVAARPPRVVAHLSPVSGARVFIASAAFQRALAAAGPERLARLAVRWVAEYGEDGEDGEDIGGLDADAAAEILCGLAELARAANGLRYALYCWMC